ncbi:hypothetical protein [Sphaerisporangium sp. TRM90804]|uniref:hypothetical protein n=1 Tax=Sphaerisporangium sp. TRM90804 TaxID=3031113 RepID=UPI002447EB04|nr:hypothetical protein [Sphaerisporangium sp. TRM90804]MDH2424412.1 hypothetical protein [Sphaerisporangium sp. TRM90804]
MDESRMWPAIGLLWGTALGFAVAFGGLTVFLVVLVLSVLGFLVGRAMVGDLDMSGMLGGRRRT